MQQHIRQPGLIGNDEAEPFGNVEPFDDARNFKNFDANFVADSKLFRNCLSLGHEPAPTIALTTGAKGIAPRLFVILKDTLPLTRVGGASPIRPPFTLLRNFPPPEQANLSVRDRPATIW